MGGGVVHKAAWSIPLTASGAGFASTTSLDQQIAANIQRILGVRCSSPGRVGELPWDPDFGSFMDRIKHRDISDPTTKEMALYYARTQVVKYEPRVIVTDVSLKPGSVEGSVVITVYYDRSDQRRTSMAAAALSTSVEV